MSPPVAAEPLTPLQALALRVVAARRLAARDAADARKKVEEAHAWARSLLAVRGGQGDGGVGIAAEVDQLQEQQQQAGQLSPSSSPPLLLLPPLALSGSSASTDTHHHSNDNNDKSAALSRMLVGNARMLARLQAGSSSTSAEDDDEAAVVCALVAGTLLRAPASSLRRAYLQQSAAALSAALLPQASSRMAAAHVARLVAALLREVVEHRRRQCLGGLVGGGAAEAGEDAAGAGQKAAAASAALAALSAHPATSLLVLQGAWSALRVAVEAVAAVAAVKEDGDATADDEAWLLRKGGSDGAAERAAAFQVAGLVLQRVLLPLLASGLSLEARVASAWARSPAAAASWLPATLASCTAAALDVHARLPRLLSSGGGNSCPLLGAAVARAGAEWATAVQGLAGGRREGGGGGGVGGAKPSAAAAVPQELRQLCARLCVAIRDGFMPPAAAGGGGGCGAVGPAAKAAATA